MLYQKLLMGSKPYFLSAGNASSYVLHRHAEIELCCCLEGKFDVVCDNKKYTLAAGDYLLILPMVAHKIPEGNKNCNSFVIELGYAFLGEFFNSFKNLGPHCPLLSGALLGEMPKYRELSRLIEETRDVFVNRPPLGELMVKSNLYRISSLLLELCDQGDGTRMFNKRLEDVEQIDKALEIIYEDYATDLDVEKVSLACGYSKSNFCRLFKAITGETFHTTLNRHRVEIACLLLQENNDTVEKIAGETGFADAKSFCRVFKKHMGKSAGAYKKEIAAEKKSRQA